MFYTLRWKSLFINKSKCDSAMKEKNKTKQRRWDFFFEEPYPIFFVEHKHIRRSSHNRKTSITDSELGAGN